MMFTAILAPDNTREIWKNLACTDYVTVYIRYRLIAFAGMYM